MLLRQRVRPFEHDTARFDAAFTPTGVEKSARSFDAFFSTNYVFDEAVGVMPVRTRNDLAAEQ